MLKDVCDALTIQVRDVRKRLKKEVVSNHPLMTEGGEQIFLVVNEFGIYGAEMTGITKSTFSDWKSGRSKPKADKLKVLADYFGVSVEYFLEADGSKKSVPM